MMRSISPADLQRIRQWFHAVEDLNSAYLEPEDYALMEHLASNLTWQPLDTMPPNTPVLLYVPLEHGAVMLVAPSQLTPVPHWRGYSWIKPTHWMPLPDPPTPEGSC